MFGKNKIKFYCVDEFELSPKPAPAYKVFPKWYQKTDKKTKCPVSNLVGFFNGPATSCPGITDFLKSGYILPAWTDFLLSYEYGDLNIKWFSGNNPINSGKITNDRINGMSDDILPNYGGFFKFETPWMISTPKGYSCMLIHPEWHRENKFRTSFGILHTDNSIPSTISWFFEVNGNSFREDDIISQKTVIQKGTPIIQVIPFKRQNFQMELNYLNKNDFFKLEEKNKEYFINKFISKSIYNIKRSKIGNLFH